MSQKRFSTGGLIVAVLSLGVGIATLLRPSPTSHQAAAQLAHLSSIMFLLAGALLLWRAFRPGWSAGRGVATWFGGSFVGYSVVLAAVGSDPWLAALLFLVAGSFLLWRGFKAPRLKPPGT
jgi:hypothetical protein